MGDTTNKNNPLPVYTRTTLFSQPIERVLPFTDESKGFDVCSIDHLPSLVPLESSREFSAPLLNLFNKFSTDDVWRRSYTLFERFTRPLTATADDIKTGQVEPPVGGTAIVQ